MSRSDWLESALAQLRQGDAHAVIRLIECAPSADMSTQAAQRILATAYAQTGLLSKANAAIERALRASEPDLATKALAGRIALDQGMSVIAFEHFDALVQIAPRQVAFWRFLCEAATTPEARARLLSLIESSRDFDVVSDMYVVRQYVNALIEQGRVDEALHWSEQALRQHPASAVAQQLWVRLCIEEQPLKAWDALAKYGLEKPESFLTLHPDSVDAALYLPELFASDAERTRWRERYAQALQRIAALLQQTALTQESVRWFQRTAFRLTYQGQNDLVLQRMRAELLSASLRAFQADKWRPVMRTRARDCGLVLCRDIFAIAQWGSISSIFLRSYRTNGLR